MGTGAKKFSSHDFSTQQHQPLPLPIGHFLSKKIPFTVRSNFLYATMEGLPVTVVVSRRCHCPLPLHLCRCLSAIARLLLPIGCCRSAIVRRPLSVGHCPSAIAHNPLPMTQCPSPSPLRIVVARFCECNFFVKIENLDRTMGREA